MRNLFLNHLILVCIVLYSAGVDYAAHQIVGRFGIVAGLAVIAPMYGAARYFEREPLTLGRKNEPQRRFAVHYLERRRAVTTPAISLALAFSCGTVPAGRGDNQPCVFWESWR